MKQGKLGFRLMMLMVWVLSITLVYTSYTYKKIEIPKLEGRVDELTVEVSARDEAMALQGEELAKAETAYQGLSQQNEQLQGEVSSRNTKVKELEAQLQQREKELEAQKQEIAKLKKAKAVSTKVDAPTGKVLGNNFQVTWYNDYGKTKSGRFVTDNVTVAVDPNVIPLGTWLKLKFPDGREYIRRADDTGGKVKGNIVDIYDSASTQTLRQRGRTHGVQVSIVKK